MFCVWGRFVAEVHPAVHTAKNCRPREEKTPTAIIHRAVLCARQVCAAGARSGAWRIARLAHLLVFCTTQSGCPKATRYLLLVVRALWFSWLVAGTVSINQWLVPPCESHVEMCMNHWHSETRQSQEAFALRRAAPARSKFTYER